MKTIRKGDLAVSALITDILSQGFSVSIPFSVGERYDLILDRKGKLDRVQVKRLRKRDGVYCLSARSVNSRIDRKYTEADIEWLAGVHPEDGIFVYFPAGELAGRSAVTFRGDDFPSSNQSKKANLVRDFRTLPS